MKHHETTWNIMKLQSNYSYLMLSSSISNQLFLHHQIHQIHGWPSQIRATGLQTIWDLKVQPCYGCYGYGNGTRHGSFKSSPQIRFLKDLENLWTGSLWENRERIAYRIKNAQHFKSIRCRNPICPLWARSLLRSAKLLWSTEHVVSAGSPIEYCGMYTVSVSGQM